MQKPAPKPVPLYKNIAKCIEEERIPDGVELECWLVDAQFMHRRLLSIRRFANKMLRFAKEVFGHDDKTGSLNVIETIHTQLNNLLDQELRFDAEHDED